MIKRTFYFGNPAYLSLRNGQMIIKLPEVEKCASFSEQQKNEMTISNLSKISV